MLKENAFDFQMYKQKIQTCFITPLLNLEQGKNYRFLSMTKDPWQTFVMTGQEYLVINP